MAFSKIDGVAFTLDFGTINAHHDASLAYTPNAGYTGVDSFTYKDTNGTLDSNVATVDIGENKQGQPLIYGLFRVGYSSAMPRVRSSWMAGTRCARAAQEERIKMGRWTHLFF